MTNNEIDLILQRLPKDIPIKNDKENLMVYSMNPKYYYIIWRKAYNKALSDVRSCLKEFLV